MIGRHHLFSRACAARTFSVSSHTAGFPRNANIPVQGQQAEQQTRKNKRIVIAVGGNALQRRGDRLTIENQLIAASGCAPVIKALADDHELVLVHGNGPQVITLVLERRTTYSRLLVAGGRASP